MSEKRKIFAFSDIFVTTSNTILSKAAKLLVKKIKINFVKSLDNSYKRYFTKIAGKKIDLGKEYVKPFDEHETFVLKMVAKELELDDYIPMTLANQIGQDQFRIKKDAIVMYEPVDTVYAIDLDYTANFHRYDIIHFMDMEIDSSEQILDLSNLIELGTKILREIDNERDNFITMLRSFKVVLNSSEFKDHDKVIEMSKKGELFARIVKKSKERGVSFEI